MEEGLPNPLRIPQRKKTVRRRTRAEGETGRKGCSFSLKISEKGVAFRGALILCGFRLVNVGGELPLCSAVGR
jgi:hypothetical protein